METTRGRVVRASASKSQMSAAAARARAIARASREEEARGRREARCGAREGTESRALARVDVDRDVVGLERRAVLEQQAGDVGARHLGAHEVDARVLELAVEQEAAPAAPEPSLPPSRRLEHEAAGAGEPAEAGAPPEEGEPSEALPLPVLRKRIRYIFEQRNKEHLSKLPRMMAN